MIKFNNYNLRKIGNKILITPIKNGVPNMKKVTVLEGIAINFWNLIENEESIISIIDLLAKEYNVDKNLITKDLLNFLEQLKLNEVILEYSTEERIENKK